MMDTEDIFEDGDLAGMLLYNYDIPVGFPPGISSPKEDFRSRA